MPEKARCYLLGSPARPLQVAIVGAGPSGFYVAEGLLSHKKIAAQVDLFDRLPTPFGLVRAGVAPDHQHIKRVTTGYDRVAALPGFRFFGNVELGRHVGVEDLRERYDLVVLAVGNENDRMLDIPGEGLPECYSGGAFVRWYNGHPDHHAERFDLSHRHVALVGMGNVALDICRILAHKPESLAPTDMSAAALRALQDSGIEDITLLGRRGPGQAAFSPIELKRIGDLEDVTLVIDPEDVVMAEDEVEALPHADAKRNVRYLQAVAGQAVQAGKKSVRLRFFVSPVEILSRNGHVKDVRLERTRLIQRDDGSFDARGTGVYETLPVEAVFRAIGFTGTPLSGIPFDARRGRIPHRDGRVFDPETHAIVPDMYVVGWARRGPTGLIGANRLEAFTTVEQMVQDIRGRTGTHLEERRPQRLEAFLRSRQPDLVTFDDWKKIDRAEIERGEVQGKIREKFTTVEALLQPIADTGEKDPSGNE